MTDERDELTRWADDFRSAPSDGAPLSAEAILAQAARDVRRERLQWVEHLGGTLFAVAVFLGLVVKMRSWLFAALAAVVLPALLSLLALFVHDQQALRTSSGEALRDHAVLVVRRRQADVRLLRASRVVLAFLAASFWIWLPFFVLSHAERFGKEPWRLVVGAGASLVVFGLGGLWGGRRLSRARAELRRWEAVAASLSDAS
jgi:hypothetical protein